MNRNRFFIFVVVLLLLAVIPGFRAGVAAEEPPVPAEKARTGEEIPFTLSDRDRLIRLEEGQKSLQRQIDDLGVGTQRQFDDVKNQFSDIRSLLYLVITLTFTGISTLIGFILWDRRTTLAPVAKRNMELEEREERLERALRAYAEVEPRMAEVLRDLRLMK